MSAGKTYLGDAVYAEVVNGQIVLTTEDGISETNVIFLDPPVMNALAAFAEAHSEPEVTLPRITERLSDGTARALLEAHVNLDAACVMMIGEIVARFQKADRAVAIEVERGKYPAGAALAVLRHVGEAMSDGNATLQEQLIPHFTEAGAVRALAQSKKKGDA